MKLSLVEQILGVPKITKDRDEKSSMSKDKDIYLPTEPHHNPFISIVSLNWALFETEKKTHQPNLERKPKITSVATVSTPTLVSSLLTKPFPYTHLLFLFIFSYIFTSIQHLIHSNKAQTYINHSLTTLFPPKWRW